MKALGLIVYLGFCMSALALPMSKHADGQLDKRDGHSEFDADLAILKKRDGASEFDADLAIL
ncbi:hypothetical protein F4808DRAFT_459907 [Astrocystis sublimbata]|nr:hypothetical protein F4808DRAFT_459907 [Astrocystis sublimbata]